MKELTIPEIGTVKIIKSARARRLSITLRPFQGIRVSIPQQASYAFAEKVIQRKKAWIQKSLKKIQSAESAYTVFDEHSDFKTRWHRLKVDRSEEDGVPTVRIGQGLIRVIVPLNVEIREEKVQLFIRDCLEETMRFEAKNYLPQRVEQLAEQLGLEYRRVFIKNTKTRWGSCSGVNNINLSLHLMRLPDHLIDYIILHELTHTIHKNHGPDFWAYLDQITGNARGLDQEVNRYQLAIY